MNIDPSHDEITERARSLWEERGRPEGQDTSIWLDAETELRRRSAQSSASGAPASTGSAGPNSTPPMEKPRRAQRRNVDENTPRSFSSAPETRSPVRTPKVNPNV